MSAFYYCEYKHRRDLLRVAVICEQCVTDPIWQDPPERELAKGYSVTRVPYTDNDRACYDCGKEPERSDYERLMGRAG